jgi:hypothetical protein
MFVNVADAIDPGTSVSADQAADDLFWRIGAALAAPSTARR